MAWTSRVRFEMRCACVWSFPTRFCTNRVSAGNVVFNGALHYSTSYQQPLHEALRVLDTGGRIAILDSPMYPSDGSGSAMAGLRCRLVV